MFIGIGFLKAKYSIIPFEISSKGFTNLFGADISKGMIDRAKSELPNLNFKHLKKKKFEFSDSQFDLILLFAVLTCIPMNKDQSDLIFKLKK